MTTLEVVLLTVLATLAVLYLATKVGPILRRFRRPSRSDPSNVSLKGMSKEESRCVSLVDRRWRKPLLHYLRTLEASQELQQHLVSNPRCLKAVKGFIEENWYEGESP